MKKTGKTAGEDGKAPKKKRMNPAARRWVRWSSRSLPRNGGWEERPRTGPRAPQGRRNPSGGGRGGSTRRVVHAVHGRGGIHRQVIGKSESNT